MARLTVFERDLLREALAEHIEAHCYCAKCIEVDDLPGDEHMVITCLEQDAAQLIEAVERAGFRFERVKQTAEA